MSGEPLEEHAMSCIIFTMQCHFHIAVAVLIEYTVFSYFHNAYRALYDYSQCGINNGLCFV